MIILTGQTKGGVGKSFLATNLAVALTRKGHKIILVDADGQKTSARWVELRNNLGVEPSFDCIASRVGRKESGAFAQELTALRNAYEYVIVDCGGRDSLELRETMFVADLMLAPVGPTVSDIWGLADLNEVVGKAVEHNPALNVGVVINRSPPINFHGQTAQAIKAIEGLENLSYTGLVITERQTYQSEFQDGKTIMDIEVKAVSAIKARNEIRHLCALVTKGGAHEQAA